MAERSEHQGEVVVAAVAKQGRFVDHHQRMHPDVALGMPLGVLRHADQGFELGEEAEQPALLEEAKAGRRAPPLQQQLADLFENTLARHFVQGRLAAQLDEGGIGGHLEAGDELRYPQRPQGVFGEGAGVGRAEHAGLEVTPASEGVDDLVGERVAGHAVDSEVAPAGRALEIEVRIACDGEAAVPRCDLVVAARQREIGVDVGETQHSETLSHPQDLPEGSEKGFQRGRLESENLDVDILGIESEQPVAHVATDEEGPSARRLHRARDIQDYRIQHSGIIASDGPPRSPGGQGSRSSLSDTVRAPARGAPLRQVPRSAGSCIRRRRAHSRRVSPPR